MRLGLRQSKAGRCAGFLKNVYSPAPVAPELPIQIGAVDFKDPLSAVQTLKPRDSHGFSFPAKPPAENKTRVCAWLKSAPPGTISSRIFRRNRPVCLLQDRA